jgi:hypothetical protein
VGAGSLRFEGRTNGAVRVGCDLVSAATVSLELPRCCNGLDRDGRGSPIGENDDYWCAGCANQLRGREPQRCARGKTQRARIKQRDRPEAPIRVRNIGLVIPVEIADRQRTGEPAGRIVRLWPKSPVAVPQQLVQPRRICAREHQVQFSVSVKVTRRDFAAPAVRRVRNPRLKAAVAGADQDSDTVKLVAYRGIQISVVIEIRRYNRVRRIGERVSEGALKRAVPVTQQNANILTASKESDNHNVELVIIVEVANSNLLWTDKRFVIARCLESTVPVPQEHTDIRRVDDGDVRYLVAVEVPDNNEGGVGGGVRGDRGLESTIPVPQKYAHGIRRGVHNQIQFSVPVEISGGNPKSPYSGRIDGRLKGSVAIAKEYRKLPVRYRKVEFAVAVEVPGDNAKRLAREDARGSGLELCRGWQRESSKINQRYQGK